MAEGNQVDRGKMGETSSPSGEKLMRKGTGHVASNEWMMRRREDHMD